MTNKEAAKILSVRDEKRMAQLFGPKFAKALLVAIAALKDPLLDRSKAGIRGSREQKRKYKGRDFTKWGKMGGRPRKLAA